MLGTSGAGEEELKAKGNPRLKVKGNPRLKEIQG
jgi:hypothetical protein